MRRFLFAAALILMLGLVAYSQQTLNANPQGGINTYGSLVYGPAPTPTPSPTPVPPTATATSVPQGNGVFKKIGNTLYGNRDFQVISACGFIQFWDESPAYGGPDGFRAEACMDGLPCYYSPPVDATGYYEVPIDAYSDLPSSGGGTIYAVQGRDRDRVSQGFRWDFRDVEDSPLGVTIRMDFRECRVDDPSDRCTLDQAVAVNEDGSYLVEVPFSESSPRSPNDYCPNP